MLISSRSGDKGFRDPIQSRAQASGHECTLRRHWVGEGWRVRSHEFILLVLIVHTVILFDFLSISITLFIFVCLFEAGSQNDLELMM